MTDRPFNVLFLCTGNSARSILAESILNKIGGDKFTAYSAGSDPKGAVHPLALELLEDTSHAIVTLRSKSWDEFSGTDAPDLDLVFTLCDSAAQEACPVWPSRPLTAHWGLPDPAAVAGADAVREAAFAQAYRVLTNRLGKLVALPIRSLDEAALRARLKSIGEDFSENV